MLPLQDYGTQCWIDFDAPWQWRLYMTLVSLTLFVIPALLISACYIVIVVTIWNKGKDIRMPQQERTNATEVLIKKKKKKNEVNNGHEEVESRRASSRGLIPKAKVKTVKMTFVIIFVFILCWSPYIVFDLLQVQNKPL